jgi:hypothetical protein
MARTQDQQPRQPGQQAVAGDTPRTGLDPRNPRDVVQLRKIRSRKAAAAFNNEHPQFLQQFNAFTQGSCVVDGKLHVIKVEAWQRAHGLKADGKVGQDTVTAAQQLNQAQGTVSFGEGEGDTVVGKHHKNMAIEAVEGGETGGQETIPGEGQNFEGDSMASDGIGRAGEDIASDYAHHGELSANGKVGLGVASRLVLVPHIVSLIQHHKYKEALEVIWESTGKEERVELARKAIETVGIKLSEHAVQLFEHAAAAGAMVDVLALGWEWTRLGLMSIYEAHEKGDRDSRVAIYAWAWSDTVLTGKHSNPGAISPEQREAMDKGKEDGGDTRQNLPELPGLLLAQYHNEHEARMALEKALLEKAGLHL